MLKKTINCLLVTCGVFLDFSKAFDTVNHNILLSKLYHYGIRGISFNWFENYLHDRTQFVKIGSIQSNPAQNDYLWNTIGINFGSPTG